MNLRFRDKAETILRRGRSWSRGRRRCQRDKRSSSVTPETSRESTPSMESIGAVELLSKVQNCKNDNPKSKSWMNDMTSTAGNKITTALHEETLQQDQNGSFNYLRSSSVPHTAAYGQQQQQDCLRQQRRNSGYRGQKEIKTRKQQPSISKSSVLPPTKIGLEPLSKDKIASLKPKRQSSRRRRSVSGGSTAAALPGTSIGQYTVTPRQISGSTEFKNEGRMQSISLGDESMNNLGRMQSISLGDEIVVEQNKNKNKVEENTSGSIFRVSELKEFMAKSTESSPIITGKMKSTQTNTDAKWNSTPKIGTKSRRESLKLLFGLVDAEAEETGIEYEKGSGGGGRQRHYQRRPSTAGSQLSKSSNSGMLSFLSGLEDEEVDDDVSFRKNLSSHSRKKKGCGECATTSATSDDDDQQTLKRIPSWKQFVDGLANEEIVGDLQSSGERTTRTSISSTSTNPQHGSFVLLADRVKRETSNNAHRTPSTFNDTESLKLWIDGLEVHDKADPNNEKHNTNITHSKTTNNTEEEGGDSKKHIKRFDANVDSNKSQSSTIPSPPSMGEMSLEVINNKLYSSMANAVPGEKGIQLDMKTHHEASHHSKTISMPLGTEITNEGKKVSLGAIVVEEARLGTISKKGTSDELQCHKNIHVTSEPFAGKRAPQSWWSKTCTALFVGLAQEEC